MYQCGLAPSQINRRTFSDVRNCVAVRSPGEYREVQKILGTHLTAEERRFVERRLAEEQALLHKLRGSVAAMDASLQRPTQQIDKGIPKPPIR